MAAAKQEENVGIQLLQLEARNKGSGIIVE